MVKSNETICYFKQMVCLFHCVISFAWHSRKSGSQIRGFPANKSEHALINRKWVITNSYCFRSRDGRMIFSTNQDKGKFPESFSYKSNGWEWNLPQLLLETPNEPKRKKRSPLTIKCDAYSLIQQMKENYIRGERLHFDVPNVLPEGEVSLAEYEDYIKCCDDCFKTVENYVKLIANRWAWELVP